MAALSAVAALAHVVTVTVRRPWCRRARGLGLATFFAAMLLASPAQAGTAVIEGESMAPYPSLNGNVLSNASASGGEVRQIWSTGYMSKDVTLPDRVSSVTVRAYGSPCNGAPHMAVDLGSTRVMDRDVASTSLTDYSASTDLPGGMYRLKVSFTNDYLGSGCDRNLFVDELTITTTSSPAPAAQCSDGLDNDRDGLTDYPADPGCSSSTDNDESNAVSPGGLFAPISYENAVLPNDAPLDRNSAGAINDLLGMVASYPEVINTNSWTTRVYTVPSNQPTVKVINDNTGHPELNEAYSAVPLPTGAQPDPESDHHLTVWQPSTDKLWEFWGAYYDSSGNLHARYGGRMCAVSTNPGHFVNAQTPCHQEAAWGATATSIPLLAGLIRYTEARALNIPHAIALAVPKSNCQYRNPAQRTDGGCTPAVPYLPPGGRLRLPASVNVDALACSPLCRAIARAVQRYGFVIRDHAGAIALYGENTGADWNTSIPGGKSLSGFPWDKLQTLPPSVG
jgi:Ca-dependent carbohydrate-binding module xylan-binding